MSQWVPLATVLVSGLFSIVVVITTAWLTSRRGKNEYERDRKRERYEEAKDLYVKKLSQLEDVVRLTEQLKSHSDYEKELPIVNAQMLLIAPQNIINRSEHVSDLLYQWSSEYKAGSPKRIGNSNRAIISSSDKPHSDKAEALYPLLNNEIIKLRDQMKEHLDELRA